MNNRTAYLVSKKLTGEISESEIQELNLQLMQDPELYDTIALIEIAWNNQSPHVDEKGDIERLLGKLNSADPGYFISKETPEIPYIAERKPLLRLFRLWHAAAAVVILLLGAWFFLNTENNGKTPPAAEIPINQVATKAGSRTRIVLRDGTKVWLNGASNLTYKQMTGEKLREVYLSGEAYFEVVSNPARPFIIHTEKTTVKVTGTTLNVRDYPEEEKAETSLLSGKAEVVATNNPTKIFVLKPYEKVVFRKYEEEVVSQERKSARPAGVLVSYRPDILKLNYYSDDTIPVVTAWVADQLVFSDEPFRDVADKMEKWYNVIIEIRSAKLAETHLNGKFEKETLEVALEALQYSTPFKYTIEGNKIIIDKN